MNKILKQAAITGGLEAISRLRLERLFPNAGGRGLIFTMHHVRPRVPVPFDPNAHLEITPAYLEQVIMASLAAGLVPVRLSDLPQLLADPADSRRFVCFTLDDGYRDNAIHAAPLFRAHGIPYTIFVTPGFVERSATLWWETAAAWLQDAASLVFDFGSGEERLDCSTLARKAAAFDRICAFVNQGHQDRATDQLNRLAARSGADAHGIVEREVMNEAELRALAQDPLVDFGAHTMTHPVLSKVSADRLAHEIGASMAKVETYSGRPVTTFAYPYGISCAVGDREFKAAADAGLRLAVTTRAGMLTRDTLKRPMAVDRVSLNGLYQKRHYVNALISGLPFRLTS